MLHTLTSNFLLDIIPMKYIIQKIILLFLALLFSSGTLYIYIKNWTTYKYDISVSVYTYIVTVASGRNTFLGVSINNIR